ncbi:hypothetical protein P5G60_09965 [Paenibacillus jamilae]|nr:hypothetical protein [Paenibacillus jamilae]
MENSTADQQKKGDISQEGCAARSVLLIPQAKTGLQYVEIK